MKYAEYLERTSFSKQELIAHSYGNLVSDVKTNLARLPAPPFLMFDRITEVQRGRTGRIVAEQDICLDAWFFQCHFIGDPVQPGCLGLDALWQLIGFYITLNGTIGIGRALGCQEVDFYGQIRPHNKLVRYEIDIRRYMDMKESGYGMAIGDAIVRVDGEDIYKVIGCKVGCFKDIAYADYPNLSANAIGGVLRK